MRSHASLGEKSGVFAALGIAPSTEDFVQEAAVGDLFEIESSQLALAKDDPDVQDFARQMIADHSRMSDELISLLRHFAIEQLPPAWLDDAHQNKLDKLAGLNGAAFTKRYCSDQLNAHRIAVSLFERYARSGDNAQLKAWAGKTLPALQHHLQMAQEICQ